MNPDHKKSMRIPGRPDRANHRQRARLDAALPYSALAPALLRCQQLLLSTFRPPRFYR
jgi:hypothetical protein